MLTTAAPPGTPRTDLPSVTGQSAITTLALFAGVMATLYFGRELFVPLALASLLAFLLAPMVRWVRRLHVARIPAVLSVVILAFAVIGSFGTVVAWQVLDLAESLPAYQANIERKIDSLQNSPPGGGAFGKAATVLKRLSDRISRSSQEEVPAHAVPGTPVESQPAVAEPAPMAVTVVPPPLNPAEVLQTIVGPLISPLATGGIVIVFVIFILLQREDLRDRLIRLAGTRDLQRTTEAFDDAAKRVAQYLFMQLIVNVTYGFPIGVGLWLIGVPNAALWGLLAIVLRFVPYIGPVVAASFPLLVSVAVDPGWEMLVLTGALFIVIELISNNFVEPWLYGGTTGLSPVAIIVAAVFWTWLWGPIGLLLSTPLTVCLVVLGQHVPQLAFLDVLFGNEPVLTPAENLYQRLLVGDPDEATERAEEFLREHTLAAFYDEVAIPALVLAEHDRSKGALDDARRARVAAGAATLVENLQEHVDAPAEDQAVDEVASGTEEGATIGPANSVVGGDAAGEVVAAPHLPARIVLCAGARGELDDPPALMLAQLLARRGVQVRSLPAVDMHIDNFLRLDLSGIGMICLSYMNSESLAHARYLVRRLRRRRPDVPIEVAFWTLTKEDVDRRDPSSAVGADHLAVSLQEAVAQVMEELTREPSGLLTDDPGYAAPLRAAAAI